MKMKYDNWLVLVLILTSFSIVGQTIDTLSLTAETLVIDKEKLDGMLGVIDYYQKEIVVGIPWEDNGEFGLDTNNVATGAVIIYSIDEEGEIKQLQHIRAEDGQPFDRFGESVAITDKYLAIGAPGKIGYPTVNVGYGPGAVYIYEKKSGDWEINQKLTLPSGLEYLKFGAEVALYKDYLFANALVSKSEGGISTVEGIVFLFRRNANGVWSLVQKLVVPPVLKRTIFGEDIVVDNGNVIISTYPKILSEQEQGTAFSGGLICYQLDTLEDSLHYVQILLPGSESIQGKRNYFGQAMAINGDELLVVESNTPAICKYKYSSDTGWILDGKLQVSSKLISANRKNQIALGEHHVIASNDLLTPNSTRYTLQLQKDIEFNWQVANQCRLAIDDRQSIRIHDMTINRWFPINK